MPTEKDMPNGAYCHGHEKKGTYRCPFFTFVEDSGVKVSFCNFLNQGSVSDSIENTKDLEILTEKYGSEESVWKKYPLGLLWDEVKECDINVDEE